VANVCVPQQIDLFVLLLLLALIMANPAIPVKFEFNLRFLIHIPHIAGEDKSVRRYRSLKMLITFSVLWQQMQLAKYEVCIIKFIENTAASASAGPWWRVLGAL